MCGINGFNFSDSSLVQKMNERIKHRGPDGQGDYIDNNMSLGHVRLSILDLSENGKQPMDFEDFTITFNGEIYNFLELREELKGLGHSFKTDCDTEVILHCYKEWGKDFLNRLNGMWAFCIYDKAKQELFISRDRFGIKPLYYYHQDGKLIFSSELKAIREHDINLSIDKTGLNYFFYQKYIGNEFTIFNEIKKLAAGSCMTYDLKSDSLQIERYYQLREEIKQAKTQTQDQLKETIEQTVSARLIADVPVGCFLSGGVDSSLISAIARKSKDDLKTFSIGFKEKSFNELEFSKEVSEHIKSEHIYETLEVDEELIKNIVSNLDEPFGDASILPTYLLSKITRKHVTVSLSGDAADELFGGYDSYKGYTLSKSIPSFLIALAKPFVNMLPADNKKLSTVFKLKKFVNDYHSIASRRHLNWMSQVNEKNRKTLLGDAFLPDDQVIPVSKTDSLLEIQLNDMENYLDGDILKKVDIATMMNSLEARVPFLDYRLVPSALKLSDEQKINQGNTKHLLKQIAAPYMPDGIIERKKRGFSVPIAQWIGKSKLIQETITGQAENAHGLFDASHIQSLLDQHLALKADNSRPLWLIFVFNYWWNTNLNNPKGN